MNEERVTLLYGGITLAIYIASKLLEHYASLLNDVNVHLFIAVLFGYGIYFIVAMIQHSQSFQHVYRRIDFIKLFGDFGRILYVLAGILCITISIIVFYIYHEII